jgi:hypothetical protein
VQVVSGSGATDAVNGKGNLIVGYNRATFGQVRTGSNNLIVGDEHEYTSYAGLVVGFHNTISGASASVSGGVNNTASANGASVSGGELLPQPSQDGWAAGSDEPDTVVGNFESP